MNGGQIAAVGGLLMAWSASAHDADVIYAQLTVHAPGAPLVETITLTADTLRLLAPIDADGDQLVTQQELAARAQAIRLGVWEDAPLSAGGRTCALGPLEAWLRQGFIELRGEWTCGEGELRQDFKILRVLPANYRIVLGTQLDGEQGSKRFAQGSLSTLTIPRPAPPGAWDGAAFSAGFDAGLRRIGQLAWWAGVWALVICLSTWRRGLIATALLALGLGVGSFIDVGALPPLVVLVVLALASVALREPPIVLPLLGGVALGALGGGGGMSPSAGLWVGSLVLTAPLAVCGVAVGRMLQRRASTWSVVKWVWPALVVLGAARLW